jgi:hypothetical protein
MSGQGRDARREKPPIRVPCQVEVQTFGQLTELATGNSPRSHVARPCNRSGPRSLAHRVWLATTPTAAPEERQRPARTRPRLRRRCAEAVGTARARNVGDDHAREAGWGERFGAQPSLRHNPLAGQQHPRVRRGPDGDNVALSFGSPLDHAAIYGTRREWLLCEHPTALGTTITHKRFHSNSDQVIACHSKSLHNFIQYEHWRLHHFSRGKPHAECSRYYTPDDCALFARWEL